MSPGDGGDVRLAGNLEAPAGQTSSNTLAAWHAASARRAREQQIAGPITARKVADGSVLFVGGDGRVLAACTALGIKPDRASSTWRTSTADANQLVRELRERGAHLVIENGGQHADRRAE